MSTVVAATVQRELLADMRASMEAALRAQFAEAEREVARVLAERLAAADALIGRLREENAQLRAEVERHERTLATLREFASDIL